MSLEMMLRRPHSERKGPPSYNPSALGSEASLSVAGDAAIADGALALPDQVVGCMGFR